MIDLDISKLKAISSGATEQISHANEKKSFEDTRFWKPERDKNGNGSAVIRFLPSLEAGKLPWVQVYDFFLKGQNGWYVNKCLRTIGQPDPMSEYIAELWNNATSEMEKAELRKRNLRPSMQYIANVLVINDPAHPENNGTVRLYRFGKKILDKIIDKSKCEFPGDVPVNVFDWVNGANFKLRITTQDKFPNYDRSEFDQISPIGDDNKIMEVAKAMYSLNEFVDPVNFKSYDELKAQRDKVFGLGTNVTHAPQQSYTPSSFESKTNEFGVNQAPMTQATDTQKTAPWEEDINFDELMKDI